MVDIDLLDVLYKIDDHDDRVALTFDELTKMVESATNEYKDYQKPWDADDNKKKRLKAIQAHGGNERFSDAEPILADDKIEKVNDILDKSIDGTAPTDIDTIMGRPAAELASFLSIEVKRDKTPTLDDKAIANIKEKLQSENIDLTKVTGITKQEGKEAAKANAAVKDDTQESEKDRNEREAKETAEAQTERLKLGKYWAMVYKILHAQTNNIGTCLEKYRERYEKAFSNDTDVRVVWDIGKYDERQHLGTILVGSYIVGHYKRDVIRRNEKVWVVYKKKSEDSFEKGMFKKGDDRVTWTEYGASLGKTSVRVADIVSARRKVHGPYYTEKQVIRAILDPPKDTLRAIVDKNKFWIECDQPKIETDGKNYTKLEVGQWRAKRAWSSFLAGIGHMAKNIDATVSVSVLTALSSASAYVFTNPTAAYALAAAGFAVVSFKQARNYVYKPASPENQEMLRENKSDTIGDEAASAAIPRVDDTFNLGAFHFDASPAMCALALQNAERAAIAVTNP
jgi:hypothetical protein